MTSLDFGWRLATFSLDGSPGAWLRDRVEEHLRLFDGQLGTVWVQDHLIPETPWTDDSWAALECWSTLTHFAGMFPSFRFGNIVMANSYRSPALLAKMAATTQLLTRGRLILGLGAGWHEGEYRMYGFDYPPPKVRIAQLEEAIQVIRALWTQAPASFSGTYYRVENAYCEPKPDPLPPIMLGAAGEQLALRAVARHADWYNTPASPLEVVQHKLDVLREHCQKIGRDYDSIVKTATISCVAVGTSRAEAQHMAEGSPFYRPDQPTAAIVGEPEEAVEQLRKFADLGVTHINVRFADFPRLDGAARFIERVIPALR